MGGAVGTQKHKGATLLHVTDEQKFQAMEGHGCEVMAVNTLGTGDRGAAFWRFLLRAIYFTVKK